MTRVMTQYTNTTTYVYINMYMCTIIWTYNTININIKYHDMKYIKHPIVSL